MLFVLTGCVASWVIANNIVRKKTDFKSNVKKRFLQ